MANQNFDIPVQNGSYKGSDRARSAMRSATSGRAVAGDTGPATQSDQNVNRNNESLMQDSQPKVLEPQSTPAKGATPPNVVNPEGRPGMKGSKTNAQGAGGR